MEQLKLELTEAVGDAVDVSKHRENRAYALLEEMADTRGLSMDAFTLQPVLMVVEWFKAAGMSTDVNVVRETLHEYRRAKGLNGKP